MYSNIFSGKRGLEVEGWEIIFRTRTPREIREEYERCSLIMFCGR